MSSSTSSSSADASITVVIGSNAPPERLAACLAALEPQRDGVEVRVHEATRSPADVRERFPWATFTTSPGALVPHHWRDGVDASTTEIVALTISQMIPSPTWVAQIRRYLSDGDVVAGAIDPGSGLRVVDWAEYFCRYSRDMLPFAERETPDLPGDNTAYRRSRLEAVRDSYRDGFWEPEVNRRLAAQGIALRQTPDLVVEQGRSAGFSTFAAQRWRHGRAFGEQRGSEFSRLRGLAGIAATPLVPLLMSWRVVPLVLTKRRHRGRLVLALPAILAFDAVWAVAEAAGYLSALRGQSNRGRRR